MAVSLLLSNSQLDATILLILGLVHVDSDFDFIEASEVADIFKILVDGELPLNTARMIAEFDYDTFDMSAVCEKLTDEEVESEEIISLLLQVAQVDDNYDVTENEYISEVADLIGADIEEFEAELIEYVEVS